jgi:hypothetical protein
LPSLKSTAANSLAELNLVLQVMLGDQLGGAEH